jgi:hypothetical protein
MTMLRIIIIFSLTVFLPASCNQNKTTKQDLANNSTEKLIQNDTITRYIPDKYEEEILDTLLDADYQFRVLIKKSTLMNRFVVQTIELDNKQIQKLVYRDNSILIKVTNNDRTLLDTLLTKEIFPQIGDKEFLSKAIMWGAWVVKYDKINQEVGLRFSIIVPDTDWGYNFIINVDNKIKKEILLDNID